MPTKAIKEKTQRVYEPQPAKLPVKKLENGAIVLEFPPELGNQLDISGGEVFFVMTGGVLQVSSVEPQVMIPVLNLAEDFGTPRV